MTHRHAICLVVDGLRASALGAYGNTTFLTPHLDVLASRAIIADWLHADSPQLEDYYRSVWRGKHALRPQVTDEQEVVLEQLKQAGVLQWLVTDEPWLIEKSGQLPFDEALLFDNEAEHAADSLEDTTLGRFFSEAIERLHQWREDVADSSSLTWLHCRGFFGPWDAPLELRDRLLDEEDPVFDDFVQPPEALRDIDDPDVLLSYRVAYAAQVAVLDACVGAFVEAIEAEFAGSETLFMLTSSRGFALGEHGSVGTDCTELYGERLHLPWLVSPCAVGAPLPRHLSLSQPADIGATLLDWFQSTEAPSAQDGISCLPIVRGEQCEQRKIAVSAGDNGEQSIRTPAWLMRQTPQDIEQEPANMLYTKADDRWEKNEIAKLCPQVVEGLQKELTHWQQCCQQSKPLPLGPQDDDLLDRDR